MSQFLSTLFADERILKAKPANILLVSNDPPLNLKPPKPSFANARNNSTFGFQSRASVAASRLPAVTETDDRVSTEDGEDQDRDSTEDGEDQDRDRSVDADEMDIDEDSHGVGLGMICCHSLYILRVIFFVRIWRSRGHSRLVLTRT
jgi:hypothetical protein